MYAQTSDSVLNYPLIIAISIIGLGILLILYLRYIAIRRKKMMRSMDTITLLVSVPKEVPRKPEEQENEPPKDFREVVSIAEQLFASLSSAYQKNFLSRLWGGQEHISLEIISQNGQISFYVAVHKSLYSMVEKSIHSQYPDAEIVPIKGHNIFEGEKREIACASLKLGRKFIYPIKTYKNLESEPLNNISNALSKLGNDSNAAIQILIQPASDSWRRLCDVAARRIQEGKSAYTSSTWVKIIEGFFNTMGEVIGALSGGTRRPEDRIGGGVLDDKNKGFIRLTPLQENTMKIFNEKGSKVGFQTIVRIITTSTNDQTAKTHRDNILTGFAQFNAPDYNNLKAVTGMDRRKFVKDYIFRFFGNAHRMLLNTEELASIYHFPNRFIETPNINWLLSRTLPAPVNLPQEGTVIGESIYRGEQRPVKVKPDDRLRHIFMIGKTGVGKTTLFLNMFEQDIKEGKGCAFVDPLGDAIEDIINKIPKDRANDVILFDPSDAQWPVGLNLLEAKTTEQKDFLIQEAIQIFYKLFDPTRQGIVGPQWEHWFRNAALTVMSAPDGGTLIDIPRIFTDDAFRERLIEYVDDPIVKAFWTQQLAKTADFHKSEMYNYFISKFGRFMTNTLMRNIIGQTKSAFNLREVMDSGKILLINLSKGKIGEVNSNLLGMVLVSKIQMSAFSRADIPEDRRKDFYLYVDEFQNFTTDTFATILSEARKYRLSLNITNQYIAQLPEVIRDAVIGNVGTMIVYRIGAADADFMDKEFPKVTSMDMVNLSRFNTYVKLLIDGTPSRPFSMKGVKSSTPADVNAASTIRQLSRQKYARTKAEVERELDQKGRISQTAPAGINEPLKKL